MRTSRRLVLAALLASAASVQEVPRPDGGEPDPRTWVSATWEKLDSRDVAGRHMLMDIARDYGLYEAMRALAQEILAVDPDHREAHRHLNHTLHQGKWLAPEEAEAAGLLKFDYTYPPEYRTPDKDRLLLPLYLSRRDHREHERRQEWASHWVIQRKPLTLRSNCTREKAERFADTFREFALHVTQFLGIPLKSNYEINIYRSQEEYHTVGGAPRGTGGYYAPGLRKLFFYDDPRDQISTYRVLFHEGTHMIVHLTCKNKDFHYPICINEGLAEYMGAARWDYYAERFTFGHPLNDRIQHFKTLLRANRAKPLLELVLHDRRGFGASEYAQAWALVTYLSDTQVGHSPKQLGVYLGRLFSDNRYKMLPDADPRKRDEMQRIFEKTFFNARNGTTWEEFQQRFWEYAAALKEEVGAPDFSRRYRLRAGLGS
ncbi:MAG: DUF1570 domain-containing protein [Planctomycetes bacterium]|nr:DUF1570 domain-containing protein [Planctomycetota bacterium]